MLKAYAWETVKTTGAIFAVNMTPIPQALKNTLPQNFAGFHLSKGGSYALAKSLVDQITNGQSDLFQMNYVNLLDNTAFFSILSGAVDKSDLNLMAYNAVDAVIPVSKDLKLDIVDGITISAGSAIANLLDVSTGNNVVFDFIRRPVSTTYNIVSGRPY
jgi:hypothetical protein